MTPTTPLVQFGPFSFYPRTGSLWRGTATWPDGTVAAQYGFRHARYQRVVYERIPAARRRHLHQQIGLRLEQAYGDRVSEIATVLAMHWQQGWGHEQALRYRRQAAEKALRHQAYREAAELETALELARQLHSLAQRAHDPLLCVAAHQGLVTILFWRGELAQARAHVEEGLAAYDAQRVHLPALLYGYNPGVVCLVYGAWILWLLGYPDQWLQRSRDAQTLACELAHPFSLALALNAAAAVHQVRREAPIVQAQAETAMAIASDYGFPYYSAWATMLRGWALAQQGYGAEGIAQLRQGLAAHRATGAALGRSYFLGLVAEACGRAGQAEEGSHVVDEALATAHYTVERQCEAELYRLKGELLLQVAGRGGARVASAATEAGRCVHQALELARRQQAKALELRAATSLGRLWQQQGKRVSARRLLAPIYGWFTEGFDTADLQEAQGLLHELGVRTGPSTPRKNPREASLSHRVRSP